MLVLSRKPRETIVFPRLGVTVEILRAAGGKVRVGIDAPPEVSILRGELAATPLNGSALLAHSNSRTRNHRLRNRLHTANLGLNLLEKQLRMGLYQQAEETLAQTLEAFRQLDDEAQLLEVPSRTAAPRRALVVEDDPNEAELLAGILRLSGYHVRTASDGLDGLDALHAQRPDFLLLDMHLPRCDGRTMLAAVRANPVWRGLRVFALSGAAPAELGVTIGEGGVSRWFQKPLDPEALLAAMNQAGESLALPA